MSPDMMSNAVYGERETIKCIGDINKNPKQWCKYVFPCHPQGCLPKMHSLPFFRYCICRIPKCEDVDGDDELGLINTEVAVAFPCRF